MVSRCPLCSFVFFVSVRLYFVFVYASAAGGIDKDWVLFLISTHNIYLFVCLFVCCCCFLFVCFFVFLFVFFVVVFFFFFCILLLFLFLLLLLLFLWRNKIILF